MNFGLLTPNIIRLMFTHPKSSVLSAYANALSSGHMTLLPGEFQPPEFFPQSDLRRRVDSRWALPQISSCIVLYVAYGPQLASACSVFGSSMLNVYIHYTAIVM